VPWPPPIQVRANRTPDFFNYCILFDPFLLGQLQVLFLGWRRFFSAPPPGPLLQTHLLLPREEPRSRPFFFELFHQSSNLENGQAARLPNYAEDTLDPSQVRKDSPSPVRRRNYSPGLLWEPAPPC